MNTIIAYISITNNIATVGVLIVVALISYILFYENGYTEIRFQIASIVVGLVTAAFLLSLFGDSHQKIARLNPWYSSNKSYSSSKSKPFSKSTNTQPPSEDIITKNFRNSINWAGSLTRNSFTLFVRLTLILLLSFILCLIAFALGSRRSLTQILICTASILLAFLIPANIDVSALTRLWIIALSIPLYIGLPPAISFLINPYPIFQRLTMYGIYLAELFIFITHYWSVKHGT